MKFVYPFRALHRLLCGILDSSQGSRDIPFELISAQNDSVCYSRVCASVVSSGLWNSFHRSPRTPKARQAHFGEPQGAVPLPDHYRGASHRLRKTRLVSLAFVGLRSKKRLLTVFSSLTSEMEAKAQAFNAIELAIRAQLMGME